MPGLGPGIYVLHHFNGGEVVDGRDKPGHDEGTNDADDMAVQRR